MTPQIEKNPYEQLRNIALSMTPEQLGLTFNKKNTVVFGVVMDWDLVKGVATIVAYQTGDASLYLSSGGGVIGGGAYENVISAAKDFVALAQNYLSRATKTDTASLPDKDMVTFHFLTNKGRYIAKEKIHRLKNHSSPWLKLFEEGNKVITELKLITDKK